VMFVIDESLGVILVLMILVVYALIMSRVNQVVLMVCLGR
jgi:hypothetical protein